jgi:hypothetical protein
MLNRLGSKYVIIDIAMATPYVITGDTVSTGKFYSMATWAGQSPSKFYEIYYQQTDGMLQPIPLYYPEYYQSMCSRLYNFGGEEVVPDNSTLVISYIDRDGYKEIATSELFTTYEEAKAYLESQTSPNYRIVGKDPFISPVPLEKLDRYKPIYQSDSPAVKMQDEIIAYTVEIFEYQLPKRPPKIAP